MQIPLFPPFSKFFKGGLSKMESRILLRNGCRFRTFDPRSPLWKRGVRGDFPELAIDVIIFSHLQGARGIFDKANLFIGDKTDFDIALSP